MNENNNFGSILCGLAFALGVLFTAALLNENAASPMAGSVLRFGAWIAGFAGLAGYWPALIAISLAGGLISFCLVGAILPKLEELVAKAGADRAKRTLGDQGIISIEDQMQALVAKFGREKPV